MATNTENITLTVDSGSPFVVGAKAYVEQLEDGALITMVDKNGITTAKVDDGEKGDAGDSGVYIGSAEPTDPDVNVWVDPTGDPYPMEDEIADAVDEWVTAHPEAITTVQDGAITVPKFAAGVVDAALNKSGYPADSKATGDAITADRTRLTAVEGEADALDARITSLATLTEGSTTGDAELIDARTVGSTTYSSLHQAIDTEFSNVKSDINKVDTALKMVEPTNKLNPNAIIRGKQLYNDGNAYDNTNYFVSDWIACSGEDVFYFVRKNNSGEWLDNSANVNHLSQYDDSKTLIRTDTYVHSRTLEANCAFIRIDNPLAQIDSSGAVVSVTFNYVPTTKATIVPWFEPYIYLTAERFDAHVTEFKELATLIRPENELNIDNILTNTLVTEVGDASNDTCFATDYYIPAVFGDVITLSGVQPNGTFVHNAIKMTYIIMYDESFNVISGSGFFKQDYVINESECKYIRVSIPNTCLSYQIASLSVNAIPTKASIVPYHAPYYSANHPSQNIVRNRKVLWLGTSIPTYGYPQILARLCGATMHNKAIGSSMISKGIEANVTSANICGITSIWGLFGLTQTTAEKQAMINNWATIAEEIGSSDTLTDEIKNIALASSYETIVDPYLTGDNAVDLIVINHGYNDNTENAIAPENDKLNPHYLEGAYNWLIKHILEANPNIGIVIFGHYSDLPTNKETALQNVADRWNIPYYLLKNDLGWSNVQTINTTKKINSNGEWETITATEMTVQAMWLGDGIHPLGVATKRIAQVSQNVFANWLKMYCDEVN